MKLNTKTELPQFVHCGCCECYHRAEYDGDCRNDKERFLPDELDTTYGIDGCIEVDTSEGRSGACAPSKTN